MTTPETSSFFAPTFSEAQLHAARVVLDAYNGANSPDEDRTEVATALPEYASGKAALPALMGFCFPEDTYENDEGDLSSIDLPVGARCIVLFDLDPNADMDVYLRDLLLEEMEAQDMEAMDEYHLEFNDKTRTVRECVQSLLDLGLRYDPTQAMGGEDACVFAEVLTAAGATRPQPRPVATKPRP